MSKRKFVVTTNCSVKRIPIWLRELRPMEPPFVWTRHIEEATRFERHVADGLAAKFGAVVETEAEGRET